MAVCMCVMMSNQTLLISWGFHCLHGSRWLLHSHTHEVYEGEISHHTISVAITKTSVSAAWRKELQGVRVCVCVLRLHWGHAPTGADWDCSWMDGQVSGYGLAWLSLCMYVCVSSHTCLLVWRSPLWPAPPAWLLHACIVHLHICMTFSLWLY